MKVILTKSVENVCKAGDIKEVSDGFARNYLLPQKLAVIATKDALSRVEEHKRAEAKHLAKEEAETNTLADSISNTEITFKVKVGQQSRLYGSITSADVAEKLKEQAGIEIEKRKVELHEPIKSLGRHEVPIRLSSKFVPRLKVVVEQEEKSGAD